MGKAVLFIPVAVVLATVLQGCSGNSSPSLGPYLGNAPEPKAAAETKPACKTTEKCAGVLRKLVESPNREWIGKTQPASAYDDGTRLFAYRALRPKLTCTELGRAIDETRGVMREASSGSQGGSRALMAQVHAELRSERQTRCKATAKAQ